MGVFWNLCLVAAFTCLAIYIVPKSLEQIQTRFLFDGAPLSFTVRALFLKLEGIGTLIAFLLFFLSLSTVFWRPVHRGWRWLYGFSAAALLHGLILAAMIEWWDIGYVFYDVPFIVLVIVTPLPIILFGTGYIGMMRRVWQKVAKRRSNDGELIADDGV